MGCIFHIYRSDSSLKNLRRTKWALILGNDLPYSPFIPLEGDME